MSVTREIVETLATLAKIGLSGDETERLSLELSRLSDFAGRIDDADTEGVAPTTRLEPEGAYVDDAGGAGVGAGSDSGEGVGVGTGVDAGVGSGAGVGAGAGAGVGAGSDSGAGTGIGAGRALREDVVVQPPPRQTILANAPEKDEACFITPKIVE